MLEKPNFEQRRKYNFFEKKNKSKTSKCKVHATRHDCFHYSDFPYWTFFIEHRKVATWNVFSYKTNSNTNACEDIYRLHLISLDKTRGTNERHNSFVADSQKCGKLSERWMTVKDRIPSDETPREKMPLKTFQLQTTIQKKELLPVLFESGPCNFFTNSTKLRAVNSAPVGPSRLYGWETTLKKKGNQDIFEL